MEKKFIAWKKPFFLFVPIMIVFFGFFLFIMGAIATPAQVEEITWIHADFPPLSIPAGADKGLGHCDRVEKLLIKHLNTYTHVDKVANYKRIIEDMKEHKKVLCTALLKSDERTDLIEYSIPSQILLPNGLLIIKSQYHKFKPYMNEDGALSLSKAIEGGEIKLGYSLGRSYSSCIDKILKKYAGHPALYSRGGVDIFRGLIQMMLKGRINCTVGYATEAIYTIKQLGENEEIMFLPIEGMPTYLLCYVGAPKNEWGRKIISQVNQVLEQQRNTPEFLAYYEYWLDENTKARYREIAADFFKK